MNESGVKNKPWKPFLLGCFSGVLITLFTIVITIIITANSLKFWLAKKEADSLKTPPILGSEHFDYTFSGKDDKGDDVPFETYKNKPMFILVWDPECVHCLSTLITVQKLYEELIQFQIPIMAITESDVKEINKVRQELSCTLPIIRVENKLIKILCGDKIPCGLIVDKKGEIVYRYTGSTNWHSPDIIQYLINLYGDQQN
ncbi:MAG TPA: redoxin domain-containing protein [Candidatus Hydrogenedens sp.]|nr:redoxin domain-containing protein [Candidatus Hydrogenedens sp.]HOL19943.1 redoxin domain-containing protein [Candidatus Hydrogenedens sp.]HPP58444.1 redoxin domain-containing protein [Candidatus Hydrogenedens sp.]